MTPTGTTGVWYNGAMEELSTTQIAARIGRSERTAQRYIASGKLKAVPLANNRYAVESADLEALLLPTHGEPADTGTRLRLDVLEYQVDNLQRRVATLESHQAIQQEQGSTIPIPPTHAPQIEPQRETEGMLPGGYITARKFAQNHGFSRDRMETWIRLKAFETTPTPYGKLTQHILSVEQQQGVIRYWQRNHIPFTQCEQCPHI